MPLADKRQEDLVSEFPGGRLWQSFRSRFTNVGQSTTLSTTQLKNMKEMSWQSSQWLRRSWSQENKHRVCSPDLSFNATSKVFTYPVKYFKTINLNDFGDSLTFHPVPQSCQKSIFIHNFGL